MNSHRLSMATHAATYLLGGTGSASCWNSVKNFATDSALQQSLYSAALNIGSGRGIFQPYDQVQWWFFEFARTVVCNGITDSASMNVASSVLAFINEATDLDRLNG